ncbi:MAG TPA: mechanosensitive ion channel domain-containing protein [Chitinophagaceae bacterium]
MNDFLDQVWLDNPVRNYFIVAGVILLVLLFKKFISHYIAWLIFSVVHHVWSNVDKRSFINLVIKPLGLFLMILVSIAALYKLKFPAVLDAEVYKTTVKAIVHSVGTIILIVTFIGLLMRIIEFIAIILEKKANLTADQADNQLIIFFKDFFKIILVIIGIILIIRFAFNRNIGSLLTGLSIVGAAIALALRESLENLIASFIIFFDKPFTIGDLVKVQNITGSVEKIGLRSTRIRTDQKTYVTVPNKQMVDSLLDNLSLRTQRRADLKLEIEVTTSPTKLEQLLAGIRKIVDRAEIEDSNVFLTEITGSSIVVQSDYYTAPMTIKEFNTIKQDVNLQSLKLMEQLDIELAGASTDIMLRGQKGVTQQIG